MENAKRMLTKNRFSTTDNYLSKIVNVKGEEHSLPIANFIPYLISENIYVDGAVSKNVLSLAGIHSDGTKLQTISINSNDFDELKWIRLNWGMKCRISTDTYRAKEYLKEAIQSTTTNNINIIYNHIGFVKHKGKWGYIYGNGCIGNNEISSELENSIRVYNLESKSNNLHASMELLRSDLAPINIMLPLIASVYLSPLNEFLKQGGYEPKLLVYLYGRTGSMKSTLAGLILSHFGDFNNTNLPMSFRDTANSIVKKSFLLKDALTVIDDFHPSSLTDEKTMTNTAQTVARGYGDRVGRMRLTSNGDLIPSHPPRGNAIITGETLASIGESGTARYLALEIKRDDINKQVLTEYQSKAQQGELISSTKLFIEFILSQVEENENTFIEMLKEKFINNRLLFNDLLYANMPHGRVIDSISWLLLGIDMYYTCLLEKGYIEDIEYTKMFDEAIEVFKEIGINQGNLIKSDNPVEIFVEKFNSLIDSKRINILSINNKLNIDDFTNIAGFEDSEYYYLIADVVVNEVKKLCKEQDEHFSINKRALLKQLAYENIIKSEGNVNTFTKKVVGRQYKLMWLYKDRL